ncbi:IclR family transcriptional regulator [Pigmentiphaga sp. NML080357]|uniref:IclR family transcriptional regulator n=1 Tax=Pigmentiphaga sp. NML080357 TaxID=2008675 RepID=UPI000B415705|nr:IclR family transcriptional regulator [Pigmentiphaga sp. NML080357]OVZ55334.1 IclR family transcriptional regulator [Pigmentiphaga sp. NML080357]
MTQHAAAGGKPAGRGASAGPADRPVAGASQAGDAVKPSDAYVQSFARGLAVIRAFNAERPAMTLTEVADAAGLTRAGARRILLTLVQLGYVVAEGRLFRLTPRILELGFAYLTSMPFWDLAEPIMEELANEAHQSCSATVLDGTDIVYVLRIPTGRIMSINLGIGSRLPAYCSAMGRVLLAGLADEEIEAVLARSELRAHTPLTVTDPVRLKEAILKVRQQGWSLVDRELETGLVAIAAPIRDRSGRTVAALNLSGQAHRITARQMQDDLLPLLCRAAERINDLMKRV